MYRLSPASLSLFKHCSENALWRPNAISDSGALEDVLPPVLASAKSYRVLFKRWASRVRTSMQNTCVFWLEAKIGAAKHLTHGGRR